MGEIGKKECNRGWGEGEIKSSKMKKRGEKDTEEQEGGKNV